MEEIIIRIVSNDVKANLVKLYAKLNELGRDDFEFIWEIIRSRELTE